MHRAASLSCPNPGPEIAQTFLVFTGAFLGGNFTVHTL